MPSKPEVLKERRKNDPEYAERVREYSRKWRESNIEKARELDRIKTSSSRSSDRESYNAYMREWTRKNSERINRERRERLKNDPEYAARSRAKGVRKYWKDPEKHKSKRLKGIYGIVIDDFNRMREEQNFSCAICGTHEDFEAKGLAVDHCHKSKVVRGLLCKKCNTSLGNFNDDVALLQKAIEYLNRFKE